MASDSEVLKLKLCLVLALSLAALPQVESEPECQGLPANCLGELGGISCDDVADGMCYTASYAVQPDDSVTFIVSATTPANTWVGLGVSNDPIQQRPNTDIVLGAADGTNSFIHDRFASALVEPPIDPSQDISRASAERMDGVTTITFNRPRNSGDDLDISLDGYRYFLFAYGGVANFSTMPPSAAYHGFGPTRRLASSERMYIPTFTECSTTATSQGLSTAEAVGIAVALSSIVSFSAGLLMALVIAYCYIRQLKGPYSPSRDHQQPAPIYKDTSIAVSKDVELKEKVAYGPAELI